MTIRVSTRGSYLQGVQAMQRLQAELDFTQRQISSGRRILNPSDDPIASSRALELREAVSRLDQFDRNASNVISRLSQEETTLTSVNNVLQRVRELALQGNNATQGEETRKLIATEMRELLGNLTQLANQQDGNGAYLFAGNREDTQPVTRFGSTFSYNGDQGQRFIQVGEGRQVAAGDPGSAVFFQIREGNGVFATAPSAANTGTGLIGSNSVVDPTVYDRDTYTITFTAADSYEVRDSGGALISSAAFASGDTLEFAGIEMTVDGAPAAGDSFVVSPSGFQDMFSTIDQIATALEQGGPDEVGRTRMSAAVNAGMQNLDQAIGKVLDIRTQIGSRIAATESQVDSNGASALALQSTLAEIQDLDYAEAISRLSAQASTLEAAQQSFLRTRQLSLFNFL